MIISVEIFFSKMKIFFSINFFNFNLKKKSQKNILIFEKKISIEKFQKKTFSKKKSF